MCIYIYKKKLPLFPLWAGRLFWNSTRYQIYYIKQRQSWRLSNMYMCICSLQYIYMHAYLYWHIFIYKYIYISVHTCTCTFARCRWADDNSWEIEVMRSWGHEYIYLYIYTGRYKYACMYMYMCMYMLLKRQMSRWQLMRNWGDEVMRSWEDEKMSTHEKMRRWADDNSWSHLLMSCHERWGAGVETQKNVRGEIGGWGRVPFNETYAPSLSTIYDGA